MVRILEADPELGAALEPAAAAEAKRQLVAPVEQLKPGGWEPRTSLSEDEAALGLLILEGLLTREVVVAGTACAELVGEGDLLRPWDHFTSGASMQFEVEWRVLAPTTVAILDRRVTAVAAQWPELTAAFVTRAVARSHALAISLAISCMTGIRLRLLVLFWHLADRFGKVRRDGILVPVPLTHETLGHLIGSRRPSVSTALRELHDEGLIRKAGTAWLLTGEPPNELKAVHDRRRATASEGTG